MGCSNVAPCPCADFLSGAKGKAGQRKAPSSDPGQESLKLGLTNQTTSADQNHGTAGGRSPQRSGGICPVLRRSPREGAGPREISRASKRIETPPRCLIVLLSVFVFVLILAVMSRLFCPFLFCCFVYIVLMSR